MIVTDAIRLIRAMDGAPRLRVSLGLLAMGVLAMTLDVVGVGLVYALVAAIGDPLLLDRIPGVVMARVHFNITEHKDLLFVMATILVAVYIARAAYMALFTYVQASTVARWQTDMAKRLFATYMNAPFIFHLQASSSNLIPNLNFLVHVSYGRAVTHLLRLTVDCLVISAIAVLLLWAQPVPTLIAGGILLTFVAGQVILFRKVQGRLGAALNKVVRHQIRALQEAFLAVKELKVFGREGHVQLEFSGIQDNYANVIWRQQVIERLPSLITEVAVVLGVLGMMISLLASGIGTEELMATLALFAAAAFRLLPLSNRVLNGIGVLHHSKPGLELLRAEFDVSWRLPATSESGAVTEFSHAIDIEDVSYCYPDGEHAALTDVSLRIARGESIGLLGSSGAGKTTLADIVLGLLVPDKGQLKIDGVPITSDMRAWQNNVGYVPQTIFISDNTVRANIAFFMPAELIDDEKVWKALALAQLDDFISSLPEGLDTILREGGSRLSGGQKQRIALARALYHDPAVLVLDEATSALDAQTESDVSRAIENLAGQKTLIIIAHRLSTLKHCDRLVMMDSGQIVIEGTYAELNKKSAEFRHLVKLGMIE